MDKRVAASAIALPVFLVWAVNCAAADEPASQGRLSLSLGTIKEKAEGAAVRALVKFADNTSVEERLASTGGSLFYAITRKVEFDVTDKGSFGGVAARYGFIAVSAPQIPHPTNLGLQVTDSSGWVHVFPVTLGVDADRGIQNRDILLEGGYVPFKGTGNRLTCFKLGGNPVVGLIGQLGRRTREPALQPASASLRRVKLELRLDFPLSCLGGAFAGDEGGAPGPRSASLLKLFGADLGRWQLMVDGDLWRDFVTRRTYRYAALTLRVPAAQGAFMDFRREVGAKAPTFDKGAQFGVYLTVQY